MRISDCSSDVCSSDLAGSWTIKPSGPARQRNDRFSLFRKVGAIHDNHRYAVVIRNLSTTGALIEGILDVPVGTRFVIDFGAGQLVTATVRRSAKPQQRQEDRRVGKECVSTCTSRG